MTTPVICIDCSPLLVRSAGVKTYLFHWLAAMKAGTPTAIRTFLAPPDLSKLRHGGGVWAHPVRLASLLALNHLPPAAIDFAVPQCDVFHISNLLRRPPRRARLSTTVHDMTAWLLPELHTQANISADKNLAANLLQRADGLIAVSENTKRDAVRILGLSPDKIRVIHLGVPPAYSAVSPAAIARVTQSLALSRPYFLFIGTIEPRKNIDTLLTAWQALPAAFRQHYELIVAGMGGWQSSATMQRLAQANREAQGIRYLGYVPETDLPALTAGAAAFVYPSLYEGFGIPVAQAMAAGCPVITSNLSSLPEITAGGALLIDPRSPSDLCAAIQRMGESADLRQRLLIAGLERAKLYTWEAAATKSLDFFASVA